MGLLSASVSITRYMVNGKIEDPFFENVGAALNKHVIPDIEGEQQDKAVGWTSFERPYEPGFEGSTWVIGQYAVFSLRIDKKSVPAKVVKKNFEIECRKRLAESGREFLGREEKKQIKEQIHNVLLTRVPAVPNVYDLIWNYEEGTLWFMASQKGAREELETLFLQSFNVPLIPMFPFTVAELAAGLTPEQIDVLATTAPTRFAE
ncbi:MAG: recombination-associated protein RdgC [Desulfatibacillaceae bacterium]